jgi:hypothetical protein
VAGDGVWCSSAQYPGQGGEHVNDGKPVGEIPVATRLGQMCPGGWQARWANLGGCPRSKVSARDWPRPAPRVQQPGTWPTASPHAAAASISSREVRPRTCQMQR